MPAVLEDWRDGARLAPVLPSTPGGHDPASATASVLLCDLNAKALDAAASELGDRAIGRVTDVSDESEVDGAMRAAREAFGSLDIVVKLRGLWCHCAAD